MSAPPQHHIAGETRHEEHRHRHDVAGGREHLAGDHGQHGQREVGGVPPQGLSLRRLERICRRAATLESRGTRSVVIVGGRDTARDYGDTLRQRRAWDGPRDGQDGEAGVTW
uniref:Uncharacterized protein n=1 Tax=Clastoptera arizonana TaxID=38151 RepID=A0A1B6CF22_9HEMI